MLFFGKDEVARRTPYSTLVPAMAQGLAQPIESPPRSHFNPNHDASTVLIMPAWRPGRVMGTKIISIWPQNNALGKPAVSAVYVLTSCDDGATLAVIGITVGELVGGEIGLGYLISFGQGQANTSMVFDAIGLLTVIGVIMYWAVTSVENRILHYLPRAVGAQRSP